LEVKSTGLDENGNWNNGFAGLGWREDFDKLKKIKEQAWGMQHRRAWVWLYQFENYQKKLEPVFGTCAEWSPRRPPLDYSKSFGKVHAGNVNLPRLLSEIQDASNGALLSVRPRVRAHEQSKAFSALILTATVDAGDRKRNIQDTEKNIFA
jgi:hypothetical protein